MEEINKVEQDINAVDSLQKLIDRITALGLKPQGQTHYLIGRAIRSGVNPYGAINALITHLTESNENLIKQLKEIHKYAVVPYIAKKD